MPRGGKVQRYPDDFKQSAIEMALQEDQTIAQVAQNLNIHPKTLYGWVSRYKQEHNIETKKEQNRDDLQAEIKRLKKENAQLKLEREILKKATAYFAKETV
jgi:transposase